MSPVNPLAAAVCVLMALLTARVIVILFGPPSSNGRFTSIDGLRGYLAFFVFMHHSSVWFFYLKSGVWDFPPSALFRELGPGSVALFFAITGFLFVSKLLSTPLKAIDWLQLYISRVFRLVPLYAIAGLLFFFAVIALSGGRALNQAPAELAISAIDWLTFGYLGIHGVQTPVAEGYPGNFLAFVTWSLPFEWFFYFSLPFLSLLLGRRPPWLFLAVGVVGALALFKVDRTCVHQVYFLTGAIAAIISRYGLLKEFSRGHWSSAIVAVCLTGAVGFETQVWGDPLHWALLTIAFVLIACGDDVFGLLAGSAARLLGEVSYSLYLLHGACLFTTFNFVIGLSQAKGLSALNYWLVVAGITPLVVWLCYATFRLVEYPAIAMGKQLARYVRARSSVRLAKAVAPAAAGLPQ